MARSGPRLRYPSRRRDYLPPGTIPKGTRHVSTSFPFLRAWMDKTRQDPPD